LSENYNVATLSRGYKRKSEGFIGWCFFKWEIWLTNFFINSRTFKWPLMQIGRTDWTIAFAKAKARSDITRWCVPTSESKSGFYILTYSWIDWWFYVPTGNLRESRSGAKRLTLLSTKCPSNLSLAEQNSIKTGWNWKSRVVFYNIDWWMYLFRKEVRSKRYCKYR
jgi:tetraacyldisaccharide 4'-kinase